MRKSPIILQSLPTFSRKINSSEMDDNLKRRKVKKTTNTIKREKICKKLKKTMRSCTKYYFFRKSNGERSSGRVSQRLFSVSGSLASADHGIFFVFISIPTTQYKRKNPQITQKSSKMNQKIITF